MPLVNGDRYYASTAVFLSEVVKFSFFLSMALYEIATSPQTPDTSTVSELAEALSRAVFTGDSWKLAIPAVLFTVTNSLQYVAASNLDAATFADGSRAQLEKVVESCGDGSGRAGRPALACIAARSRPVNQGLKRWSVLQVSAIHLGHGG